MQDTFNGFSEKRLNRKIVWILLGVWGALWSFCGCHSLETKPASISDENGCLNAPKVEFVESSYFHIGKLKDEYTPAFFSADVKKGEWLKISTANEQFPDPTFDAVISLYSADGKNRIATVDDNFLWNSSDSLWYFHAFKDETVCIKMEPFSVWANQSEYITNYDFSFGLEKTSDVTLNTNANSDSERAKQINWLNKQTKTGQYSFVNGVIDSSKTEHWVSFQALDKVTLLEVILNTRFGTGNPTAQISGSGTSLDVEVTLFDSEHAKVSQLALNAEKTKLMALLSPNEHYFLVFKGATNWQPGTNDFYSNLIVQTPQSEFFFEPLNENDTLETAGTVSLPTDNGLFKTGVVYGEISSNEDVDVYKLEVNKDEYLLLACFGKTLGSGIEHLTVNLLSSEGEVLKSGVEQSFPINWSDGSTATDSAYHTTLNGPYYLQISGTETDDTSSRLYSCSVAIAPL